MLGTVFENDFGGLSGGHFITYTMNDGIYQKKSWQLKLYYNGSKSHEDIT